MDWAARARAVGGECTRIRMRNARNASEEASGRNSFLLRAEVVIVRENHLARSAFSLEPHMHSVSDWVIWQLVDSAFPGGGFAHSAGLEAALQLGEINGRAGLGN